jgi:hypothetical protein
VRKPGSHQVALALTCLVGMFVALQNTKGLDGTEFSGGWLTGPLLSMADIGMLLFLLALVVAFLFPRVATAIGLASSLLCLPLDLYLIAPVPFNQIFGFRHEFKVRPGTVFPLDKWAITGVLTLAVTTYICIRGMRGASRKQTPSYPRERA